MGGEKESKRKEKIKVGWMCVKCDMERDITEVSEEEGGPMTDRG